MTLPATLDMEVLASWDGSGDFDGPYDDITEDVEIEGGVSLDMWRAGYLQLSPMKAADGSFALRNEDGFYSQDRADSAIYQRVTPGKPVQYQAGHGEAREYRSHTTYRDHVYYRGRGVWPLGRHLLLDIDPTSEMGNQRVKVDTVGYENLLTKAQVTVGVMTAPRVDQCFTALLDAVGWPTDKRDISVSDTTLLYWWCDNRAPWTAMQELLAAEGPGAFGVRRDGTFYFENRNYRTTATRSTVSQATFWDREDGQQTAYRANVLYRDRRLYRGRTSGLWFTAFRSPSPYKNVFNRATYRTIRRTLGSLAAVWSYGAAFTLGSGQSRTLIARPQNPFLDAVTPALSTDYAVSGGTVSVSMAATSGLVAFITITATSGTPTVDSVTPGTGIQLRAKALTPALGGETTVENSVDASASIAAFSPIPGQNIPLTLPDQGGWPEIDIPNAVAVCDAWVTRYQVPRPQVGFTLRNATGALLEQILRRQHSDRVTLIEANSGISADFWLNSARLVVAGAGGRSVALELGSEKTDDVTGAVWDESEWDDVFATWGI